MIIYLMLPLLAAFVVCAVLAFYIRTVALRFKILSTPGGRHREKIATPLLGGVAIFLTFAVIAFNYPGLVINKAIIGIILASLFLIILGMIDDIVPLSWKIQLTGQFIAALIVILSGIKLFFVNNPFGGSFRLDQFSISIFSQEPVPILGAIFIVFWLILFANTFNWLDGLDGLASGIGAISFISLAVLSLSSYVYQPPVAILSSIIAGSLVGFLFWNFPPARIFLGGSSAAIGFLLGAVSIFAGAKVATAFLVFTIPIIDALWVIFMRFSAHKSIFSGDISHLHYRLLDIGLSSRKTLFVLLTITAFAGFVAIVFSGLAKFVILLFYVVSMLIFLNILSRLSAKNNKKV